MAYRASMQAACRPLPAVAPRAPTASARRRPSLRAATRLRATESDADLAQARVMQQVEASASVIDEMMEEIARETFLRAAVSLVSDEAEEGSSSAEVVAEVVGKRLEQLDESFLATLDAYIHGAGSSGAADVAEVLVAVRDEVLRRVGQRLPVQMRLLNALLAASDGEGRADLLRRYAVLSPEALPQRGEEQQQTEQQEAQQEGEHQAAGAAGEGAAAGGSEGSGEEEGLHCLAEDLERAVARVIGDMELMLAVPDRKLLARLVLLREEVQQLMDEGAFFATGGAAPQPGDPPSLQQPYRELGAVPRSCAIFLQRLMALQGTQERKALLEHALSADREGQPASGGPGPNATNFEKLRAEAEKPQDWVRPGRFLQSVNAMQQEMLAQSRAGEGASPAVLERLESIRRDTVSVLIDLAGDEKPYSP